MASSIQNVTVVDSGAYDCGICECPLKPPIFQCEVGHMLCSECKEKMAGAVACHVCQCALAGGYKRCYGAEKIVKGLKVPCPNKAYGCYALLFRHEESAHLQDCEYRPFHCPAEDCTFVTGDLVSLHCHFEYPHRWRSTTVSDGTNLALVDGFNVIEPSRWSLHNLVLLKVTRESYGRVVTAIHIVVGPRHARKYRLKLAYETPCGTHRLDYAFNLASTDLSASGGLPSHDDRFDFVVPKSVQPLDLDTIKVAVTCWHLD